MIGDLKDSYRPAEGQLLIDGEWCNALSGETFIAENPSTQETVGVFARAREPDVDRAVRAARRSVSESSWTGKVPQEREQVLQRIAELILENRKELAFLESIDVGKPFANAYAGDIPGAARNFRHFAGWVTKIYGETCPVDGRFLNYVIREPHGVVGVITPWNFPLAIAAKKIGLALATGNSVVFKPAEQTSLTALRLGEIAQEAGLPDGVLNIVTGYGEEAGEAIVKHPLVNMISFTGEAVTGQLIQRNAAATLKKCVLELGGKAPNVVFADCDLGEAVSWAYDSAFGNQGQNCNAGTRLFLEKSIKSRFVEALLAKVAGARLGDPLDDDTTMGPLASQQQFDKVLSYIDIGKQEGARLVCGGGRASIGDGKGYFVEPTIFDRVQNDMRIAQEEIFGPVLTILEFEDIEEVLQKANDVAYGLAACVFTKDLVKAHHFARSVDAGTVWVNCHGVVDPNSPYGGRKLSGLGTEGGLEGILEHTQPKSVWVNIGLTRQ